MVSLFSPHTLSITIFVLFFCGRGHGLIHLHSIIIDHTLPLTVIPLRRVHSHQTFRFTWHWFLKRVPRLMFKKESWNQGTFHCCCMSDPSECRAKLQIIWPCYRTLQIFSPGVAALYKGLGPTLLRTMPATGALFLAFETVKKCLSGLAYDDDSWRLDMWAV